MDLPGTQWALENGVRTRILETFRSVSDSELGLGLQRALELDLEFQAYLSFRCTASQVLFFLFILVRLADPRTSERELNKTAP